MAPLVNQNHLRLGAFNCQGAMRSVAYISTLLESNKIDILCLSEHWLFPDSLCFLNSVSTEFCSCGVSDENLDVLDPYRRGKGGVAIMWRKVLNQNVTLLPIDSDRIIGISVELERKQFITILAVYLPSTNADIASYIVFVFTPGSV